MSAYTLAYGELAAHQGLHIMAMPTPHFVEANHRRAGTA